MLSKLSIMFFTMVIFITCSSAYSNTFDFNQTERAILKFFDDGCDESTSEASLFPDIYLNTNRAISCEISYFFGRKGSGRKLGEYFSARIATGEGVLYEDLSHVWKIKSETKNLSVEGKKTYKQLAKNEILFDLNSPAIRSATIETALLGDPYSIYALYLLKQTQSGLDLDVSHLKQIGGFLGNGLVNLLFLSSDELINAYPSREAVETLLDEVVSQSAVTSQQYLRAAARKFVSIFHKHPDFRELQAVQVLRASSEFRQNLLRLHLMTNSVPESVLSAVIFSELNDIERNYLFGVGLQKTPSQYSEQNEILELVGCLERFEEASYGLVQVSTMWGDALCIQSFQYKYSDIEALFSPFYKRVPFGEIKQFTKSDYDDWLLEGKQENNFYRLLAFGDFRHIKEFFDGYNFAGQYAHQQMVKSENWLSFTKPFEHEQLFGELASNSSSLNDEQIFDFLEQYDFSSERLCKNISARMCAKIARTVFLGNVKKENLKIDLTSLGQERCSISKKLRKVLRFFDDFNHTAQKFLTNCGIKDIANLMGFSENEFHKHIIKFSGLPNPNTMIGILQNQNFYQNEFFSQISAHYNSSSEVGTFVEIPHQGMNYVSSLSKNLHLVDNAILRSNPISQIDIQTISFERENTFLETEDYDYKPFFGLAKTYENVHSYESAFLAYHLAIVRDLFGRWSTPNKFILKNKLVSAVASARNAGIPEPFLKAYISEAIKAIDENADSSDVISDGLNEGFLMFDGIEHALDDANTIFNQYLIGGEAKRIKRIFSNYLPKEFADNFGKILSVTPLQLKQICKDYEVSENLEAFLNSREYQEFYSKSMVSEALMQEAVILVTKCRNEADWLNEISDKELKKEYETLLSDFGGYLAQGLNPVNPKYLPFYETLAEISSKNLRPLGAILSLTINKYLSSDLSVSFVMRDSSLLRNSQSSLENIWSSLFSFGVNGNLNEKYGENFSYRFNYNLNSQSLNFHFPLATTKTRNRLVTGHGRNEMPTNEYLSEQFSILTQYLKKENLLIAEAENPLEYLFLRARKSQHNAELSVNSFNIANTFESFLFFDQRDEYVSDKAIVNLVYGKGKVVFQFSSLNKAFFADGANIDYQAVLELKKSILRKNEFDNEDLIAGCKIFKPLHDVFRRTIQGHQNLESLVVVPSTNLLPIPSEIILGSFCNNGNWHITHAGDMLAAVEYSIDVRGWQIPSHFIGVGNPTSNDRGVKLNINLGSVVRGLNDDKQALSDLNKLPPLIDAVKEIENISQEFDTSSTFIGEKASVIDGLSEAQKIAKMSEVLLLFATHGIKPDYDKDISIPSLLSSNDGSLELVSTNVVDTYELKNSVVFLSACDTAGGFIDKTDLYFTGFTSSFANAGANLILSSLWPVYSDVSRETSEIFVEEWKISNIENAIKSSKISSKNSLKTLPFVYLYP